MLPKWVEASCATAVVGAGWDGCCACAVLLAITMVVFESPVLAQIFSVAPMWAFGVGLFETDNCCHPKTRICVITLGFPVILNQCLFPAAGRTVNSFLIRNFLKFIGYK